MISRSAVEQVPEGEYLIPLGKARIVKEGKDVTGFFILTPDLLTEIVVGYGAQILVLQKAVDLLEKEGISVELIDLSMISFCLIPASNSGQELLCHGTKTL